MIKSSTPRAVSIAAALVVSAGLLSACGTSSDTTDGAIVVAATGPETGANAAIKVLLDGAAARFDEINAQGGIGGHQIKFVRKDDQYNPAQTPQQIRQLVEDDGAVLVCGLVGTGPYASVKDYLSSKGVVGIPASGSASVLNEHTFEILSSYDPLGARLVNYALDTLNAPKIAVAYSADDVGQPFLAGTQSAAESRGVNFAATVQFDASATDFSSQAALLKQSGADMVLVNHVPTVVSRLQNAAKKIGYEPLWGSTFAAAQPEIIALAPDAASKTYFATPFLLPDAPEADSFRSAMNKFSPGTELDGVFPIEGYTVADGCIAVLEKAVEIAGGDAPSAQDVLSATKDLTIDSDYIKDLSWTDADHSGQKQSQIVSVKDSKFVTVDQFSSAP